MGYDKRIQAVKKTVEEAVWLIKENHAGANPGEARRLLSEAGNALKADRFKEAVNLSKKAQLAAKPTTEYLLSRGRTFASGAENSFGVRDYKEALTQWKKSLEEYNRARDIAVDRGEIEIIDKTADVEATIKDNISKAEIARDNREMLELVDSGNNSLEIANRLFKKKKFNESNRAYEDARKAFRGALLLADKRDFEADREMIKEALASIDTSIHAAILSECDAMLSSAEVAFKKRKFADAEMIFARAVVSLEAPEIRGSESEKMLDLGKEGIIRAKIEQGRVKMRDADTFIENVEYYNAKEGYKAAREYLEGVLGEVSNYKFPQLVEELNEIIQTCSQNISSATTALMDVAGVEPEIITVDRVGSGAAKFSRAIPHHQPVTPAAERLMEKYTELDYLGGGGFADVYRAVKKDGRVVAVKVPRNLDEKSEKVFFRELHMWEQLRHRNIVTLINPYLKPEPHFEIEYTDRGNLDDLLKNEKLGADTACRIAFDIACGLEYAHNKHIIHGDITPKNILLTSVGDAKITDFGLSKIVTSLSELKGYTLPFASVEMLEDKVTDEKSDTYQLGLTFYIMLTGNNPFNTGSRYDTEERIKTYTPEPPSRDNSRIAELDDIIMRTLSKNPNDRPSLEEFRERIYAFVKKDYNESLHLSEDVDTIISTNCSLAIFAARQGDTGESLRALRNTLSKVRVPEIREELNRLIAQVEYMAENGMGMEGRLEEIETFLKKVKREG